MKKNFLLILIVGACFVFAQSCGNSSDTSEDSALDSLPTFQAIDMPSTLANGDAFPTDSNTIDGWVSTNHVDADGVEINPNVIGHAWGLWAALVQMTDQTYEGRNLRLFETWYSPQDVMTAASQGVALKDLNRTDGGLQMRKKFDFGHDQELNTTAGDISGKVKYSPAMAQQALEGNYFDVNHLNSLVVAGEINSVDFKPNNVMLKPVYRVLTDYTKVAGKENTHYFHIWGGKQDGGKPDADFSKILYVTTDVNSPDIDDVNTYSIDAFIHHRMSAAEAYTYNNSSKEGNEVPDSLLHAKAGDPVILLGMHVSTRESERWTWQSFYWTESPDNPIFPSSATIAEGRNALNPPLPSPTDRYTVTIGYSFMSPALPFKGPAVDIMNAGVSPVYALNPYIEGTFDASVFPRQDSFYSGSFAKQMYTTNVDGITSNCMGCHSQSYYNKQSIGTAVDGFISDQYIQRDAPWFEGSVQLDFVWSLFPGFEPKPSKVTEPSK